jgi:phosphoribosylglycinamide formyltransferase 1
MSQELTTLGILISGRGSNMQAIVSACRDGRVSARVGVVVSNRHDAAGLTWARDAGIPTVVLSHKDHPSREAHDIAVVTALREAAVEWVCLAGYMRLLSRAFIDAFPNRILNIHPSLLPAFPGLDAQHQAWTWGVRISGCTVHLVDDELDHGPIVVQRPVAVADDDDAESLAARILAEEHRAYPEALSAVLVRKWRIEGRRVVFLG